MEIQLLFSNDLQVAKALIARDEQVTRSFFYKQCYPLFKSIYDHYYTDCESCKEFIDEIYVLVLAPSRVTGRCQLESFRGESTLTSWLKTVCVRYCYAKYELKERLPVSELIVSTDTEGDDPVRRQEAQYGYVEMNFSGINRMDVNAVLRMMPNKRYSTLIRLRYLEGLSNEETAEVMCMTIDNYYNKHKLAKTQFEQILRKEIHHA